MVTPVTIEGLTMEASSTESTEMQVHVQWPVLPGHQAQRGDGDVGPGPGEGIPGRRPAVQRAAARDQRLCPPLHRQWPHGGGAADRIRDVRRARGHDESDFLWRCHGSWAIPGRDVFADAKMPEVIDALVAAVPNADKGELSSLKDRNVLLDDAKFGPTAR